MKTKKYKLVAPDIDRLLNCFNRDFMNPSGIRPKLARAMKPLFKALEPLAPLKSNDVAKAIWIFVPRGEITDYDSFEDMKEWGRVKTYKQYQKRWLEDYPDEIKWYRLVIVEEKDREGVVNFRGVGLARNTIISARIDEKGKPDLMDEYAAILCNLLVDAAKESVEILKKGKYNSLVDNSLPYEFKTGVIKRSTLWKHDPEFKKYDFDGLSQRKILALRKLIVSGKNDEQKIARIKRFCANDFFYACKIGYKACGYKIGKKTPAELYLKYADGRDEGLTGTGHGLNEGPGINFESSKEWDAWYFNGRGGGHPWEIIRGGNSTHVDLFVRHDKFEIDYLYRSGKITEKESNSRLKKAGYFFEVCGKHRPFEAVSFYTALAAAGLPVKLCDAEEILARFDGSDYVGIVPHKTIPRYCEELFPKEYGRVIDFMHVYDEDLLKYGADIIWLPEEPAKLKE